MSKNKKRILIADDQPEVRELLTRSLNTAEWNVVARQTGREALAYVVEQTDPVTLSFAWSHMPVRLGRSAVWFAGGVASAD